MNITRFWTVHIIRFVTFFFIFSVAAASYFFPGGNIHDPSQIGYSFSHNFLSELGGYITFAGDINTCLLYTSPSPRDQRGSRMPSSA